ncbi:hypothetical protein GCM10009119_24530 [Algoriphagus jejuensis]|uniref:Uncharacterized protein n=2 Tax=Algoriphagus jejuensis TaxID=419934 RepID=A0ABN1N1L8_9BACT
MTWFLAIHSQAQDLGIENKLTLSFGPSILARQDLIFSPNIHNDFSFLNFGLGYTREAKLYQTVRLNYAGFNPMVIDPYEFTEYGEFETAYPHSFNLVDLDYSLGKKVLVTEKSALTIGGMFSTNIQAMNYVYGRFSNFGYFATLGLGAFVQDKFTINEKSHLTATLQLPFVSWLSRSPYLVNDDEFIENIFSHSGFKTFMAYLGDGQLATWNKLQTFDLEAKYSYTLSERWDLSAAYAFEFIHASQPRNLLSFRNALNLSATLKF